MQNESFAVHSPVPDAGAFALLSDSITLGAQKDTVHKCFCGFEKSAGNTGAIHDFCQMAKNSIAGFSKTILIAGIFFAFSLQAKIPERFPAYYNYDHTPEGWFISAYGVFNYANYNPQPGTLSVKFPYILTDRNTNTSATMNFTSVKTNLVGTGKWVNPGIGLEIGKDNFSVEGGMGLYIRNWSDYLYFGMNYRFILYRVHRQKEKYVFASTSFPGENGERLMADFPVKISCGIFYWQPVWDLGDISISDKQFYALGHIMQDRDSLVTGSSGTVHVLFHQNYIALTPNLNIGYRPQNGRIDFSFRISPLITIAERGGLRFYMTNSGSVEWAPTNGINLDAIIPMNSLGLDASFNGSEIQSSPFRLRGIMYTLRVGIRLI